MVIGGHSDPCEVCLPSAGGHQDVHWALCSALISETEVYAQEGTKQGVHSRSFAPLLAYPQTGPKPTLGRFSASIILRPFLSLLIVLAEYLGSPSMRRQSGNAVATAKSIRGAWNAFPAKNFTAVRGGLYYVRQYSWPPLLGLVSADGGDHGDHAAHDHGTVLAEPLAAQPDTSNYYSQQAYTDTFAPTAEGFYDPYASNFLTQEQDRTDTGLLGGLTIGVLVTVFLAALLGSIVAPALTAAVTRCQRI